MKQKLTGLVLALGLTLCSAVPAMAGDRVAFTPTPEAEALKAKNPIAYIVSMGASSLGTLLAGNPVNSILGQTLYK